MAKTDDFIFIMDLKLTYVNSYMFLSHFRQQKANMKINSRLTPKIKINYSDKNRKILFLQKKSGINLLILSSTVCQTVYLTRAIMDDYGFIGSHMVTYRASKEKFPLRFYHGY